MRSGTGRYTFPGQVELCPFKVGDMVWAKREMFSGEYMPALDNPIPCEFFTEPHRVIFVNAYPEDPYQVIKTNLTVKCFGNDGKLYWFRFERAPGEEGEI